MSSKTNWIKQVYYYSVLGVAVFLFGVSIYVFLLTILTNFVFTDLAKPNQTYVYEQCIIDYRGGAGQVDIQYINGRIDTESLEQGLDSDQIRDCSDQQDEKNSQLQESRLADSLVSSILGIVITSVVIFIFNKRKS